MKLKRIYQCGHCGTLHKNKKDLCCGDFELEESYQCPKCDMLFAENWEHKCKDASSEKDGGKKK